MPITNFLSVHRLADVDKQTRALKKRKQRLLEEIAESDKVSGELHKKALELAQFRELESCRLAEDARDFIAKYSKQRKEQQQKQKGRKNQRPQPEDDPNAVVVTKEMRKSVKKTERGMDLILFSEKLKKGTPSIEKEAAAWKERAEHAVEQERRATTKLKAVPRRFRETVADVRTKLIAVLEERASLSEKLSKAEQGGVRRIEELHELLNNVGRKTMLVSDDLNEVRKDVDHWRQQCAMVEARCEPLRRRVAELQRKLLQEGSSCSMWAEDFYEAVEQDNIGLILAVLEGLSSYDESLSSESVPVATPNRGSRQSSGGISSDMTSIPVRCVKTAVLEYLAPEHANAEETLSEKSIDEALSACGLEHITKKSQRNARLDVSELKQLLTQLKVPIGGTY